MALFENFPYTNLQQLNLNWIIKKIKSLENSSVLSVNGMTGNVILYEGQSMQLPGLENVQTWAIWRNMNNRASGIQLTETGVEWVDGSNRVRLLTSADIPADAGVISINGEAGVVIITGEDVNVSTTDTRTISAAISALIATDNSQAADIVAITNRLDTAEDNISTLEQKTSNIETLTDTVETLSTNVSDMSDDVSQNTSNIATLNTTVLQQGNTLASLNTAVGDNTADISTLETIVSNLQNILTDFIITRTVTTEAFNISAGGYSSISVSMAYTGYTYLGIVAIEGHGSSELAYSDWYKRGNNAVVYYKNTSSSAKSDITLSITGIYIKQ